MKKKKFNKSDFKKIHPSGSLGAKLKTVEDIMLTNNKIPFVNENLNMGIGLKILTKKKTWNFDCEKPSKKYGRYNNRWSN